MTTQPTALVIADRLMTSQYNTDSVFAAAAELRRQHEEIKKWVALHEGTASLCEKRGKRVEELEAQLELERKMTDIKAIDVQHVVSGLEAQLAEAQADAERGRFMIANGGWYRSEEQTHLAVLVPHGSDLSCVAMRRDAIDTAMKGKQP